MRACPGRMESADQVETMARKDQRVSQDGTENPGDPEPTAEMVRPGRRANKDRRATLENPAEA